MLEWIRCGPFDSVLDRLSGLIKIRLFNMALFVKLANKRPLDPMNDHSTPQDNFLILMDEHR
jgi:hypothetical protein